MEKIESFDFVLDYLKAKLVLTTNGKNRFVLRNDHVLYRENGSGYSLTLNEFADLYGKAAFYVLEDNSTYIDDTKDEAYYRYYKK